MHCGMGPHGFGKTFLHNNNSNNSNHDNVYGAIIMTKVIARVHLAHLMNVDWAQGGSKPYPQIKPIDLGCESAENWQLPSTSTVAILIITQPISWCITCNERSIHLRVRSCKQPDHSVLPWTTHQLVLHYWQFHLPLDWRLSLSYDTAPYAYAERPVFWTIHDTRYTVLYWRQQSCHSSTGRSLHFLLQHTWTTFEINS